MKEPGAGLKTGPGGIGRYSAQPQDGAAARSAQSQASPQRQSGPQPQLLAAAAQLQDGEQVQGSHLHSTFMGTSIGVGTPGN